MKKPKKQLILTLMTIFSICSCKSFLEIDSPKDSATPVEVFSNDAIATSAIAGIYSAMAANGTFSGNQNSISAACGLSADEFISYSPTLEVFFKNDIPINDLTIYNYFWSQTYNYIYTSNAILEGLKSATGVTENTAKQLQGEALFIRAFCYFYLVNLFGEVPLNLTTDYRVNNIAKKASTERIYTQITDDLINAENLLSNTYPSTERIRPNRAAAKALLSRTYLYTGKWSLAEQKANEVIEQTTLYELLNNLDQIFLKNSREAIWQLMPTAGNNSNDGALFILTSTPIYVSLSPSFPTSFENNDNRKIKWIGEYTNSTGKYFYPFKYKIKTTTNGVINEYSMVIRLAEIYLIRAEARIQNNNINMGIADLNKIRLRPFANGTASNPISPIPSNLNKSEALLAVEKERKIELFSEYGHRWFDIKRSGRSSDLLIPVKGSSWKSTDALYPIPEIEIIRNPNVSQNLGYSSDK